MFVHTMSTTCLYNCVYSDTISAPTTAHPTPLPSPSPSPALNGHALVHREYSRGVLSNSFTEMRSTIQSEHCQNGIDDNKDCPRRLQRVLQPNRESVEDAIGHLKPTLIIRLVSAYFHHSEDTARRCLSLYRSLVRARSLYAPLHELLLDPNYSQTHPDHAFHTFQCLDSHPNPFPNTRCLAPVCSDFTSLKDRLDSHLRRPRKWRLVSALLLCRSSSYPTATAACVLRGTFAGKEAARLRREQVEAATRGTLILHDLHTIDCLVDRLYWAVDEDKHVLRLALERGPERHMIQEVLNHLRKNHLTFVQQLDALEEHICLCFNTVNKGRSHLLDHIYTYQTFKNR